MDTPWIIERLNKGHQRTDFESGHLALDQFLKTLAGQYSRKRIGQTHVAVKHGDSRVFGYYTACSGAIDVTSLPEASRKHLPKHPIPTLVLGRLAVDRSARGLGLGRTLLFDFLRHALDTSQDVGVFAVETHAKDEPAKGFYQKHGFVSLDANPLHLLLSMKTIAEIFS